MSDHAFANTDLVSGRNTTRHPAPSRRPRVHLQTLQRFDNVCGVAFKLQAITMTSAIGESAGKSRYVYVDKKAGQTMTLLEPLYATDDVDAVAKPADTTTHDQGPSAADRHHMAQATAIIGGTSCYRSPPSRRQCRRASQRWTHLIFIRSSLP